MSRWTTAGGTTALRRSSHPSRDTGQSNIRPVTAWYRSSLPTTVLSGPPRVASATPHRMSCSETSTRVEPEGAQHLERGSSRRRRSSARGRGAGPATSRRCASGSPASRASIASSRRAREHVALDAARVVGLERRGRSPRTTSPCRRRRRRPRRARARRAGTALARRSARTSAASARELAGRRAGRACRWRSVWRTTPAWVETWKPTPPPRPDDELRRAAADVDHEQLACGRAGARARRAEERRAAPPRRRSIVRASRPKRSRTAAANSAPLAASRTARVSTAVAASQPCASIAAA